MTLFEAQPYDEARALRRKGIIVAAIAAVIVIAAVVWLNRFYPEEHVVNQFFEALQTQSFETLAYGVWMHDPDWKQHPERYTRYSYNEFLKDWGPGGEWGIIKSHHVGSAPPFPAVIAARLLRPPAAWSWSSPSMSGSPTRPICWVRRKTRRWASHPLQQFAAEIFVAHLRACLVSASSLFLPAPLKPYHSPAVSGTISDVQVDLRAAGRRTLFCLE